MQEFISEVITLWRRQKKAWRVVVIWMVVDRFLRRFVEQYANIYIRLLGASPVQLGAVHSTAGIAGTIISVPLGLAHDRYSLRKIYLTGIALLTAVPFCYAVAPTWEWLVVPIVMMGIGRMLGSCGVICDVSLTNRDRATGKALCEGFGSLPTLFAPILAAALISLLGGVSVEGIRTLYWLYFAVAVIPTLFAFRNLPEISRSRDLSDSTTVFSEFKEVFERGTALKRYLAFTTVNHFTRMMLFTFIYPYSYEIGSATPFVLGGISTAMTLAEVLFSTVFGRLADGFGRKKAYYVLVPMFIISNLLFFFTPSGWFLVAAGFFFGFRIIASVVYSSIAPELVPNDCIGRWRGVIGLLTGIATMLASIAGGYIWEQLGAAHLFSIATAIDLLVAVPLLWLIPETLKEAEPIRRMS